MVRTGRGRCICIFGVIIIIYCFCIFFCVGLFEGPGHPSPPPPQAPEAVFRWVAWLTVPLMDSTSLAWTTFWPTFQQFCLSDWFLRRELRDGRKDSGTVPPHLMVWDGLGGGL